MPSQQEVKWSQLKVGVIILVSVFLLTALLFLMTSASGMAVFSKKIVVTTYFDNSGGLKVGAPVNLEGVTIGEVTKVLVSTEAERKLTPVKVVMKLDPKYHESLHKDSTASLSTVGVLGDTVVDINSKVATGSELETGDELRTKASAGISDVVESSQKALESLNVTLLKLNGVVDDIQKGRGTVGKLVTDPELYDEARGTVHELHVLAANINSGKGSVGKLMHDDALYNQLSDTNAKLNSMVTALNDGKGTAGKLLKDESLYNNLNATVAQANTLLTDANNGKGALGMLAKDPVFAAKLNDTVTKLNALVTGVNDGRGTLGKLATDDAAYTNLNKLLNASTDLVTTIRSDPKKYLTIHLKIF